MQEAEIQLIVEDLRNIGGSYAQAKDLLAKLPDDIRDRLYSKRRTKQNVRVRQKVIVLLKDRFDLSFPAIADLLTYADHTAAHHLYHKAKRANQ